MSLSWKQHAGVTINEALREARKLKLSPGETIKHVDAAYPFGQRKYYPYKAWLQARRELCGNLPGVRPAVVRKRKPREAKPATNTGPDLFSK